MPPYFIEVAISGKEKPIRLESNEFVHHSLLLEQLRRSNNPLTTKLTFCWPQCTSHIWEARRDPKGIWILVNKTELKELLAGYVDYYPKELINGVQLPETLRSV